MGARRVRELFAAAKRSAPCIVFLDEIDAIGAARNPRDQQYMKMTLNQARPAPAAPSPARLSWVHPKLCYTRPQTLNPNPRF